jgi:MFS family permease
MNELNTEHPNQEADSTVVEKIKHLPRNIWIVSATSFFMDISSEMVLNILPLYLSTVLGVKANIIGLIEGVAEATASILKLFSGWLSDRLGSRKWLAVAGYGLSALAKPFFYIAQSWEAVAGIRWADRIGKGIRTAPRDALVADNVKPSQRGLAFGLHRAADTAGAMLGILIAVLIVSQIKARTGTDTLTRDTFQTIVLVSMIPAILAVLVLAIGTKESKPTGSAKHLRITFKGLGKPFAIFMLIVGLFDLGNSSDAFLILRAENVGMNLVNILIMLAVFNLIYALISTPAGILSDRIGRRKVIIGGWIVYALIYLGFALAKAPVAIWLLYVTYGIYYGMAYGTAKAMISDIVPYDLRGTAFGTYNGILGILDFPASLIAGLLWSGLGSWQGFGPSAPFYFGAIMATIAVVLFVLWKPNLSGIQTEPPAEQSLNN